MCLTKPCVIHMTCIKNRIIEKLYIINYKRDSITKKFYLSYINHTLVALKIPNLEKAQSLVFQIKLCM